MNAAARPPEGGVPSPGEVIAQRSEGGPVDAAARPPERRALQRACRLVRRAAPTGQRGHAALEATLVTVVVALVLIAGDPSPLEQLLDAMQEAYGRFTYAIAMP